MNKKVRMFQALLIVAILLLQMIIPIVPSIAAGETITIQCKDKNFYNAIKKKLGEKVESASDKDLKLTALKSDVESIDTLDLSQNYAAEDAIKIKDISGIENFKGLTSLDLYENQISDISAIEGLTKLETLYLSNNQISDISKLSGLTNLTDLSLCENQISDISAISGLTNLTRLDLSNNQISDISKLSGLTNLTSLYLSNNQISDISELSGLTKLTNLNLYNNQISKISQLSGLTNLTMLDLSKNQISDISVLKGLTNLKSLDLSNNQISDISAISGLTNLTNLGLYNNQINNISALAGLTNLTYLHLSNNQISDISALSGLTNLEYLYLNDNQIRDISAISGLTNLTMLDLSNNKINDISALSSLVNLVIMKLGKNQISDINKLANLTKLETLHLNENQISDITVLAKLTNLKWLNLSSNEIDNINALAKLSKIRVLLLMYNKISDISELSELIKQTNITNLGLMNQQLTIKTEDEVELPQIFKIAKDKDNLMYTADEYELENCELTADNTKVKLKEKGKNASVKIIGGKANGTTLNIVGTEEAQKTLESIKITTPPTKTVYTEGEKFNPEGMKVTATYSDETTEEITDYTYTPAGELKTTDTAITVSYKEGEKTVEAKYTITVKAKPPVAQNTLESIKITKQPTKLEYIEGESFDKTGMEVKACYSDKTETVITNYEITNGENLTKGQTSVTIKYTEGEKTVEATQAITVKAKPPVAQKTLESIEIVSFSKTFLYTEGEDFDTTELKIEAKYSDNSSKELKEGEYEIVDGKNLKVGQNSVTIRYTEGEKTVETTHTIAVKAKEPEVEKTLSKIEITTPPTKTAYTEGEKFDKTGMKVTATYSDGTTKEVTDYTYTPAGELKTTDTAITVSYKEGEKIVEAKHTITVKAKPPVAQKTLESIKVTTAPTKTAYTEGEKFDKTGMKVIATYSDGTTKEIKNYAYTPAGALKTTDKVITVSYTENGVTKTATQEITVVAKGNSGDEPGGETEKAKLDSIEIKEAPTKTVYTEGEKFDKTGMKVIAKYSDGTTKEIKNYAYTPAGELTKKDTTITVSYTENGVTKTATQEITVVAKGNSGDEPGGETEKAKLDSIEIKEAPTKTVYTEGEKFDKTGMKVIAKYSDGTTKEIKNYAYTPAGELTKKDTTITVSYTENGVTKTDTQKIKIQNKDDGTGAKDKFPDTGAQIPIISGIVLMFAVAVASVVKIKRLTGI